MEEREIPGGEAGEEKTPVSLNRAWLKNDVENVITVFKFKPSGVNKEYVAVRHGGQDY